MIKKYWYEEGMWKYMQYKGLCPVIYVSEDGVVYRKSCMAYREVNNGKCQLGNDCAVFQSALTEMEAHWDLRDKTLGQFINMNLSTK